VEATSTKTWKKESNFRIKTGTGNSSNLDINTKGLRNNTYQFHKRINVRLIPESSRWLISQGKYDDAENIIQRIAKVNKKKIPSRIIDEKTLETPKAANVYHLFSTFAMIKRTLILG
jgi:hypothetical protein